MRTTVGSRAAGRLSVGAVVSATWLAVSAHAADRTVGADNSEPTGLAEVTVTASRREESLSKVPISVSAYTQEAMDLRGIKDIDDVARFTPGIRIDSGQTNQIAIRGIPRPEGRGRLESILMMSQFRFGSWASTRMTR